MRLGYLFFQGTHDKRIDKFMYVDSWPKSHPPPQKKILFDHTESISQDAVGAQLKMRVLTNFVLKKHFLNTEIQFLNESYFERGRKYN